MEGNKGNNGNRGIGENRETKSGEIMISFTNFLMQNFPTEEIYHLSNTCREHVIDLTFGVKVMWTRMLDRKANGRSQWFVSLS